VIRKKFDSYEEARDWRHEAQVALRKGAMRTPTKETVSDTADTWLEGARSGAIRNRSGDPYKPSAVRSYERALRLRVLPEIGSCRLSDVRRSDLQELVEKFIGEGHAESTIQMTFMPLRAIFRREVALGRIAVNPTSGLVLPAVRGKRDRIADPGEAAKLIEALPVEDRALWATAMYAGLRRGELMALRWQDVDLANGVIRVERGWDDKEGVIDLKSRQGRRRVPIATVLRDHLTERKVAGTPVGAALVFGRTATVPFYPGTVTGRADTAWEEAELQRITATPSPR
jgi:integrase